MNIHYFYYYRRYQVGLLTKRVRPIRIINMLTQQEVLINVCAEDTFYRIAERYSPFCQDSDSYAWRQGNQITKIF